MKGPKPKPIAERFWSKVDKSGGQDACWPWLAKHARLGYGTFVVSHGHFVFAHRMAYTLAFGEIPDGKIIMHKCDNPPCCNPAHLVAGTMSDNTKDMVAKRRYGAITHPESVERGSRRHNAKLTEQDVIAIRAATAHGITNKELARRYGVVKETINGIVKRRAWRHI